MTEAIKFKGIGHRPAELPDKFILTLEASGEATLDLKGYALRGSGDFRLDALKEIGAVAASIHEEAFMALYRALDPSAFRERLSSPTAVLSQEIDELRADNERLTTANADLAARLDELRRAIAPPPPLVSIPSTAPQAEERVRFPSPLL